MQQKRRIAQFRIDSVQRTEQGALKVRANLTKTGVFPYQLQDGTTIREYRAPEEVFNHQAMDSLHGCPVTLLHPSEFVTTGNWEFLSVGSVIAVEQNDPYVSGTLLIHDQKVIQKIEAGELQEISCGYTADIAVAPEGAEHYDAAQQNLNYNHAAIGPAEWGRLGTDVGLRLDTNRELVLPEAMIMPDEKKAEEAVNTEVNTEVALDNVNEVTEVKAEEAPSFNAEEAHKELIFRFDSLLEKLSPAEEAASEEEVEKKEDSAEIDIDALVEERANLLDSVRENFRVLCPEADPRGMTISELCLEGLKTVDADGEGHDEKGLVGMLKVAANSATKAVEKVEKTDSKPSFAAQLVAGKPLPETEAVSFADQLKASVS